MIIKLPQRIQDKIKITGECWLWTGYVDVRGYGRIAIQRKSVLAHRFMREFFHGKIPAGLYVLHKCDVRNCVNPDHLFVGTAQDNMDDMHAKGRANPPRGERSGRRTKPHRTARGERTGTSKLNRKQVREIINAYTATPGGGRFGNRKSEFSLRGLARKYNVGVSTIRRIINGESWVAEREAT